MLFVTNYAIAASKVSGQEIYTDICSICHEDGVAGAPKFGDKDAWKPRIAKGKKALYKSTMTGVNVMPAHTDFERHPSDSEIKKAVDYMIRHSKENNQGGRRAPANSPQHHCL